MSIPSPRKRAAVALRLAVSTAFLLLPILLPPAAPAGEPPKTFSLENPKYQSLVVAQVGPRRITAREFLLNYAFGPAFPKREKDAKGGYLRFMIYEKLLALDAYKRRLDTTLDARLSLAEMEGDLATEELYRQDILRNVKVTPKAVERGVGQEKISCTVRWIFARSSGEADALAGALRSGASFDSLYRAQFADTAVKRDDRSMEMSRFKIGMRNPALAAVIDTLPVHHVSSPIQTADGWYFLMLSDVQRTVALSESEDQKLHEDVRRALMQHIADSCSDRYVQGMLKDARPTIVRRTMDILHVHFANIMLPEPRFASWRLSQRLLDRWGPVRYDTVDPALPLIESRRMKLTAQDFLHWYTAREENLTFSLTSPEALFASLEGYIWQMARDRMLTARAYKRGFQKTARVREQLAWWKDKIVYNILREQTKESLHPTDDTLVAYYHAHPREFRDSTGAAIPYDRAKDDVLRSWYAFETTRLTVHRILKLKEEYRIKVEKGELDRLSVDSQDDARAIDVYVVKPGGIFPRPAFPTIDYDWQAWN